MGPARSDVKPRKHSTIRTLYQQSKHGGGSVTLWGCVAALGPLQLAVTGRTMNSALDQKLLNETLRYVM